MEHSLPDYQASLQHVQHHLQEVIAPYGSTSSGLRKYMAEIDSLYTAKLLAQKPQIMVYGIYNAGKSSIINELVGADSAVVSDIPTTDKVDYYDWKGYRIADTPGVGAPIKHEQVTEQHLKQADVVLFVMSTSGSNEKAENYSRMKHIAEAGKKIIIVLNDKNGDLGRNDIELQKIKTKVSENMRHVGIADVESKYCIVVVNAMRAHNGRVNNKPHLWEKSNFSELGDIILNELKRTTGFERIRNLIVEIEKILQAVIAEMKKKGLSTDLAILEAMITTIRSQKRGIRKEIHEYIQGQGRKLGRRLPDLIWAKRNQQEEISIIIQHEIEQMTNSVQKEMETHIRDMCDDLSWEIDKHIEKQKKSINITPPVAGIEGVTCQGNNPEQKDWHMDIEQLEKILQKTKQVCDVYAGKKTVESLGDSADSMLVTVNLAGTIASQIGKTAAGMAVKEAIAGTAIGKMAIGTLGRFVPYIGPIIMVGSLLYSLFGSSTDPNQQVEARNEQARRQAEAENQARQELQQKCLYLSENIADELSHAMGEALHEIIDNIEEPITKQLSNTRDQQYTYMKDLAALEDIYNELDIIRLELSAQVSNDLT